MKGVQCVQWYDAYDFSFGWKYRGRDLNFVFGPMGEEMCCIYLFRFDECDLVFIAFSYFELIQMTNGGYRRHFTRTRTQTHTHTNQHTHTKI